MGGLPCIKDVINPYNCLLKNAHFSIKTRNEKIRSCKLINNITNSQFIVVLDGIICFSGRFCDNSLLGLKMRLQVFSFASKMVQWFFSEKKILMSLLSVLLHLQNRVSAF